MYLALGRRQRRQSGFKCGGRGSESKNFDFFRQFHKQKSIFQGKFPKNFYVLGNLKNFDSIEKSPNNFNFFQAILLKNQFFWENFRKISIFQGKFPENRDF